MIGAELDCEGGKVRDLSFKITSALSKVCLPEQYKRELLKTYLCARLVSPHSCLNLREPWARWELGAVLVLPWDLVLVLRAPAIDLVL